MASNEEEHAMAAQLSLMKLRLLERWGGCRGRANVFHPGLGQCRCVKLTEYRPDSSVWDLKPMLQHSQHGPYISRCVFCGSLCRIY